MKIVEFSKQLPTPAERLLAEVGIEATWFPFTFPRS
jgi:hypothetical protein